MPFVANDLDEEEQKPQGQGAVSPVGGGGVHLAPTSGVGSSAPAGAAGTPAQGAGGSFATLDKYITANQGQAEPLAGKITGAINQQYGDLDQGNQGVLQGIAGQVSSAPGYTKGDNDLIAQESANPVSFAADSNNVANFQKQLTNTYGGPQSAEGQSGFQDQQAKINDVISQGNAQTQTAAGRKQLIAKNSATPTTGVTALNSAILSEDPNYLGQVESAYKPFQNLVTGLNSGGQDIDKTIASKTADAAASSKAAQDAITGQMTGLNTAINNQLTTAQTNAAAQNTAAKQALISGTMTPQALQTLGISQEQWDALSAADKAAATSATVNSADNKFGAESGTTTLDPSSWLTQQDPNAVFNAGNVATADQYAKAGAFQNLLGGLNLAAPTLSINPATAAQAGTAPTNLNTFDYKTALQNATDTKSAETAAAQAYVDALQSGADEEHAQLAAANAQKNSNAIYGGSSLLAGTGMASGIGYGMGAADDVKNAMAHPTLRNAGDALNSIAGPKGLVNAGKGLVKGISGAVNTVSNIFCFHPWTPVDMADGSTVPICKIVVGDLTKGGKVLATRRGVTTEFYWYAGTLVTGKHAVKENGRWCRIENAKGARRFPYLTEVVCNLVTEQHRIWANGVEYADEYETDSYETLSLDQSIEALNNG